MIKTKQIYPNLSKGPVLSNPSLEVEEKAQQKPKNPPPQIQDDQYNYEDTNNYYHNENYRGQSRGCRPYRGQNTGHFFRGQNFHGRGQRNQNHIKANIKMMPIKEIITRVIEDFIITHVEISLRVIATAILEVEAMAEAEVIIVAMVTVGPIIKVMLTINTISIMVMMMSTRQSNMVHLVHCAAAISLSQTLLQGRA